LALVIFVYLAHSHVWPPSRQSLLAKQW